MLPLVVLLVILPAVLRFLTRPDTPEIVKFGFLLLLTLLFVLPVIFVSVNLMVGGRRRRTTVTASPAGIRIEQRSAWRTRTIQVLSSELLDLDCSTVDGALRSARGSRRMHKPVGPGTEWLVAMLKRWVPATGIIVKSQHELITFGEGLPAGELQFLTGVLRNALAGR